MNHNLEATMAKHTGKALRSASSVNSRSKHTGKAMSRTTGFGKKTSLSHTSKAMSRAGRPTRPSPQIQAIRDANKRRNFTGVPKTR